jgi:hypothetical protein
VCLWLKKLHGDLGRSERCIVINCDKVGAIKLTKIQGPHGLRMLRQAPLALKGCSTQRSSLASAVLLPISPKGNGESRDCACYAKLRSP